LQGFDENGAQEAPVFSASYMMSMRLSDSRSLLLRLAASLLLLAGLSACAVKTNSRGNLVYGVDTPALFGTEIGQFPLQNGGLGTLRREGKNFSVKLSGNQRVVPINNVESARIARTENVGSRTVVVIETQRRNCDYRYSVLAIEGSDVLSWDVGNCRDRPVVLVQDDRSALTFDFPKGSSIERFVYTQDGRMRRGNVKAVAGLNPRAKPFADESLYPPGYMDSIRLHGVYPPPAAPARAPSAKPFLRPMRCISNEANQVTTAPATVINANGSVDNVLLGASMWPVNAVSVKSMEMAATNRPWQIAKIRALRRPLMWEADRGIARSVGMNGMGRPVRQARPAGVDGFDRPDFTEARTSANDVIPLKTAVPISVICPAPLSRSH